MLITEHSRYPSLRNHYAGRYRLTVLVIKVAVIDPSLQHLEVRDTRLQDDDTAYT